jgi:HK97 family phage major capsid protein
MPATDAMIARLESELEERNAFVEGLVATAEDANPPRDLNSSEMEMIANARARIASLGEQLTPLRETSRLSIESRRRATEIDNEIQTHRRRAGVGPVEYRSAGSYISEFCRAGIGDRDAAERLEVFNRAAAHQTTADNPGLLPERLLGPILNNLDFARPLVGAVGPQQLPSGSWSRPRVTQHTLVGKQTAEKTELPSRKMLITKVPLAAETFGGYVNIARQNVDWSQPQVLDLVISDLTSEYAFETEEEFGADLVAAAQTGPVLPTGALTTAQLSAALWAAAGLVFANMWTARTPVGRLIMGLAPNMLELIGPLYPAINPQNSQSSGLQPGNFAEGVQNAVGGITPVVSGALPAGTALIFSSNAVEVWEDRIGALQVVEPSVLGVQVAYAGYFADPILEPTGIVEITKTP